MKKKMYARRIAAVLGLIICLVVAEQVAAYFVLPVVNFSVAAQRDRRNYEGQIDMGVFGASLVADGVDPKLLDEALGTVSFNMGTNAQSMKMSYYGLMDLLQENELKRVVIEVSIHRMSRDLDSESGVGKLAYFDYLIHPKPKALYVRDNYSLDEMPRLLLESARCQLKFIMEGLKNKFSPAYIAQYMKQGYATLPNSSAEYGGRGFLAYDVRIPNGRAGIRYDEPRDGREVFTTEEGKENLLELQKIVKLCRDNGVEPVLITMPCADSWVLSYQDSYEDVQFYLNQVAKDLKVTYYDFNLSKKVDEFMNDTHYKDPKHMNKFGAEVFTKYLAEVLRDGAPKEDFYQTFAESALAIGRVTGVGMRKAVVDGKPSMEASARHASNVRPEFRFMMKPMDVADHAYEVVQEYSESAVLSLEGMKPGKYSVRVEARDIAHPERTYDAYAKTEITIK